MNDNKTSVFLSPSLSVSNSATGSTLVVQNQFGSQGGNKSFPSYTMNGVTFTPPIVPYRPITVPVAIADKEPTIGKSISGGLFFNAFHNISTLSSHRGNI